MGARTPLAGCLAGRAQHWAIVGSLASVRLLWSSFAVAFVACAVLHLTRLPELRAFQRPRGLPYALPRWLRAGGAALLVLQPLASSACWWR
jgi:hypothetical protein